MSSLLLIQPNVIMRRFTEAFLRGMDHTVACAETGDKTFEWLRNRPCDAVILEIDIPETDGLALLRSIRADHPNIAIVVFTHLEQTEIRWSQVEACGADGCMKHNINPVEFYDHLTTIIERKKTS